MFVSRDEYLGAYGCISGVKTLRKEVGINHPVPWQCRFHFVKWLQRYITQFENRFPICIAHPISRIQFDKTPMCLRPVSNIYMPMYAIQCHPVSIFLQIVRRYVSVVSVLLLHSICYRGSFGMISHIVRPQAQICLLPCRRTTHTVNNIGYRNCLNISLSLNSSANNTCVNITNMH